MRIRWTPEAERDRLAIWDYLVAFDPDAARRMDQRFSDAVAGLAAFPYMGHEGMVIGTREITPHRSYRIVYEIVGETVWILTLIHTARQWPPLDPRRS